MKLRYSRSVCHCDGGPIFSLDYHPNGEKLVTCGQRGSKEDTGLVIVWNISGDEETVLCEIQLSKIANCVRWSKNNDGKYLACADDLEVTVYQFEGKIRSAGSIGSLPKKNGQNEEERESYKPVHRLRGHDMDVLNVEWSQDGRFIASSSVDGVIVIWDAANLPTKVVQLDQARGGHSEAVKGISFDPVGKFFTSQSADRTLKVWTTDDWKCTETIDKPFSDGNSSMFLRHDWSPDGSYLVAPGASNNGGPTAQIICRNGWTTDRDFVGHHKTVTCVKACPLLLHYTDHKEKKRMVSCFAVGSSDKSLSIWCIPSVRRPILVLSNLFKHSIVDLSWNGYQLAVSSMDGTVRFLAFQPKELGYLLTREEMRNEFQRIYKMIPTRYDVSLSNGCTNGSAKDESRNATGRNPLGIIADARAQEIRRIEKKNREELLKAIAAQQQAAKVEPLIAPQVPQVQTEVRTKSGKRKIMPVFLGSIAEPGPEIPAKEPAVVVKTVSAPEVITSPIVSSKRRRRVEIDDDEEHTVKHKKTRAGDSAHEKENLKPQLPQMPKISARPTLRPILPVPTSETPAHAAALNLPLQRVQFVIPVEPNCLDDPVRSIYIDNNTKAGEHSKAVIGRITALSKTNSTIWTVFISGVIALGSASARFLVVGTFDREVMIVSRSTGRILHHFAIDGVAVRIVFNRDNLLVLTSVATVFVWDLQNERCLLRSSAASILENGIPLLNVQLSKTGIPVLELENGKVYSYIEKHKCWHITTDKKGIVRGIALPIKGSSEDGLLSSLICGKYSLGAHTVSLDLCGAATEMNLEHALIEASSMESSNEYRNFLMAYVQHCMSTGNILKVQSVLSELTEKKVVCGYPAKFLLEPVCSLLKKDVRFDKLRAKHDPNRDESANYDLFS